MISVAQKDALLEYASGAIALTKDFMNSEEVDRDVEQIGELYCDILAKELDELDFETEAKKIKTLRAKYEWDW